VLEQRTRAIPFADLSHVHRPLRREILAAIGTQVERNEFVNGPAVAEFEEAFTRFCGTQLCIGVASGLDALRLALQAADIEPGDEVIVPANTFIATLEAVTQVGAVPVLVDASFDDYNVDPAAADAAAGPRTRLVIPVHLYGQLADMASLTRKVPIVEDACQAHGATRDGYRPGADALAAAFSFYPAKNLGAIGDAGALVTNDPALAGTVRMLCEHGQRAKYEHERVGWTARLDAVQAAVLSVKLPHLDGWNEQRRAVARAYGEALAGVGDLGLPPVPEGSEPVWHLYVVRTARPDELGEFLGGREIATGRHYPVPPHLSPAYASLGYREGSFPVTETLAKELLSFPIFPGMSESQIATVVEAVEDYFSGA
jgi:dTDP-3-amino-3,4,6-trideoxy-alpha-D-glucose transaminase